MKSSLQDLALVTLATLRIHRRPAGPVDAVDSRPDGASSRDQECHGHLRQRQAAVRTGGHRRTGWTTRPSPVSSDSAPAAAAASDAVIDAAGKYVMPGIVNAHMHWHEERQPGMPQPIQDQRNLYPPPG